MTVKINGELYIIKGVEEETTNNLFSVKSNIKFRDSYDNGDENESWSLNSFDNTPVQEGYRRFFTLVRFGGKEKDDMVFRGEKDNDVALADEECDDMDAC
ncbi:hypothetical protein SLA2020_045940 [Shorea laevis]